MQSVSSAWTAEEKDPVQDIAHSLQVSWKKESTLGNRTFTIGVSTIGGPDAIGINPGAIGSPGNYKYFDESAYVLSMAWERGLSIPYGGMSMALAEARLDNTSRRFTPHYMGGESELFTAILPRRPIIINAGFNFAGIDQTIPQFSGLLSKQPRVKDREAEVDLQATDYLEFFNNRYTDMEIMFTGQRTDQVLETLFQSAGMSTAQYELDQGLNTISFGLFDKGSQFGNIINEMVQAENGNLYQDEAGKIHFENRQHWDNDDNISLRTLLTSEVIDSETPSDENIINVVEIKSEVREKQINQVIYTLGSAIPLPSMANTEFFVDFEDPILQMDTPSIGEAWTNEDGTGTDITASVTVTGVDLFAKVAKITLTNSSALSGFLTALTLTGRPARVVNELYYRNQNNSSVSAYEERALVIDNKYIQNESWAESLSLMIMQNYSTPENLQKITIKAIPELQLGDLISWRGIHWRVFNIKTSLSASSGFIQELNILKRFKQTYFRVGISTIGSNDAIAP